MKILGRGFTSSCVAPALSSIAIDPVDGVLRDVDSGEWTVSGPGGVVAGPVAVGRDACPIGDKLRLGNYVLPWAIPVDAMIGRYVAEWSFVFPDGSASTFSLMFEVIEQDDEPFAESYASVDSMRCEGFPEARANDQTVASRLKLATSMIDLWTGQRFVPEARTLRLNGSGGRILHLQEPIAAVGEVSIEFVDVESIEPDTEFEIDVADLRVYNRHLTQRLLRPDDRRNPQIRRLTSRWPTRPQNVIIDGVFGFTEFDGQPVGGTPRMIAHATRLLAGRNLDRLSSGRGRRRQSSHLIIEERTIDQQEKRARPDSSRTATGQFSGDPEIDTIIEDHRGPLAIA